MTVRNVFIYIIVFNSGMLMYIYFKRIAQLVNNTLLFLPYFASVLFILLYDNANLILLDNQKSIAFVIYMIPLMVRIINSGSVSIKSLTSPIAFLGKISFTMYLYNYMYIGLFQEYRYLGFSGSAFYFIFTVIIASMIHPINERLTRFVKNKLLI